MLYPAELRGRSIRPPILTFPPRRRNSLYLGATKPDLTLSSGSSAMRVLPTISLIPIGGDVYPNRQEDSRMVRMLRRLDGFVGRLLCRIFGCVTAVMTALALWAVWQSLPLGRAHLTGVGRYVRRRGRPSRVDDSALLFATTHAWRIHVSVIGQPVCRRATHHPLGSPDNKSPRPRPGVNLNH